MEKEENNIFEIHSYLDLKGSPEEIMRKIIEKIPDLDDIGYAGYLEKKWLNKIILGFMLDKNGDNKSYLYDLEYKNEVENICEETIKVCERYIDNKIHIFLFPTLDKFTIEKLDGVNGFSSWDNVILIFINFVNGWKESLAETIVHELAHAVSPFYKGGDFSIGCGLVLDESEKYDGYNWHDVYAEEFRKLGDEVIFLDFKKIDWLKQIKNHKPDLIMWRA